MSEQTAAQLPPDVTAPDTAAPANGGERRHDGNLGLALLIVLLVLFFGMLIPLVTKDGLKPEVITLVGGWGGTVLAMIGMIVSFEFGSSKGSQIKDRMLGKSQSPPVSGQPGG